METQAKAVAVSMAMPYALTQHAAVRMHQRNLLQEAIEVVMEYGRAVCTRGAVIYALGKQEAKRLCRAGLDLARFVGIQVVCSMNGTVMTVYRNNNFRGLKRRRRQRRQRCWQPGY